jgi:hypothetical protein
LKAVIRARPAEVIIFTPSFAPGICNLVSLAAPAIAAPILFIQRRTDVGQSK